MNLLVDTGFSGFLALPQALVQSLGLPWLCRQQGLLADGTIQVFDVYTGTVVWDGHLQTVEVDGSGSLALLGMSLMRGHELMIKVDVGGAIEIIPLA